jgi:cysteine-rich repeat protein
MCNPACHLTPITCGNTKVEAQEECDDGNKRDDDGCSNGCTVNQCGNKRVDPGEECDDGNTVDLDYCSNTCKRDQCRNGRLDPGEECDDGNAVTNDGCTNDCRILFCGDGKVYSEPGILFEECDDANHVDNDGCSNHCTKNVCGNDRVDPGELCDGLASTDPADPTATCDACSMWKSDPCVACMKDKCNTVCAPGADCPDAYRDLQGLYNLCYVEAKADDWLFVTFGAPPYAGYTVGCTALDRCVRRNACSASLDVVDQPGPGACMCGDLSSSACATVEALPGPCANEWFASMNGKCDGLDGVAKVQCYAGEASDLSFAPGVEYYLAGCRWERCPSECGLSPASH